MRAISWLSGQRRARLIWSLRSKGTRYQVLAGWLESSVRLMGIYEYQSTTITGDPKDGEEIHITARAVDFIDKAKGGDRRHYDEENGFGTAGKIFDDLASEMGVAAVIPSELRSIRIPYRLRWNQSAIDFATDLADEIGAITKPQAGRLVIRKRGAGASASGLTLPAITVHHDPSYAYEFTIEPRPDFKETETPWFDPALGITRLEKARRIAHHLHASLRQRDRGKDRRQGGQSAALPQHRLRLHRDGRQRERDRRITDHPGGLRLSRQRDRMGSRKRRA
jgi:phage protein D